MVPRGSALHPPRDHRYAHAMNDAEVNPTARIVVVAFNNHIFGLDEATGARVWRFDFDKFPGSGHVVRLDGADDVLYALGMGTLACIHLPTGRVLGTVQTGAVARMCTLLAARDRIVIGVGDGTVKCFSRTGQLLWEDGFKGEGASEVALAYGGRFVQADRE
jgi:outer membrane protein assembly factor BamB